jgi:hypothetical protein
MDALNTFFVFNISASIAVLVGFLLLREDVVSNAGKMKARLSGLNFAGFGGAATSMVLLASVASLFR